MNTKHQLVFRQVITKLIYVFIREFAPLDPVSFVVSGWIVGPTVLIELEYIVPLNLRMLRLDIVAIRISKRKRLTLNILLTYDLITYGLISSADPG